MKHRLAYIDAVKCLQALPPSAPGTGATSRYEEYVVTHVNLTDRIHLVVSAFRRFLRCLVHTQVGLRADRGNFYLGTGTCAVFTRRTFGRGVTTKVLCRESPPGEILIHRELTFHGRFWDWARDGDNEGVPYVDNPFLIFFQPF